MPHSWLAAVLAGTLIVVSASHSSADSPRPEALAAVHLARALETRAFTERTLQRPLDGTHCEGIEFVAYSRGDDAPQWSDTWHTASQIWADLSLPPNESRGLRCLIVGGLRFLDRLWDGTAPSGGYLGRSDLRADQIFRPDKYGDDNALVGLMWVEAAQHAPDPDLRQQALQRARATASFLTAGGLWDDTFGGGFWWNTHRGDVPEGKPVQTTGLAAALFFRLYELTGDPDYLGWARRSLEWVETRLYDPEAQLYRWNVHYAEPSQRQGEHIARRFFGYDQGIMIEAHLLAYRLLGRDPRHLERARLLGWRLDPVFWDPEHGGYNLEAGIPQVFTVYSAWLTPSLLALYAEDHDPYWLERAMANVDALNATLWDPGYGGYYQRHLVCRDQVPPDCESGDRWVIGTARTLADQAWMQRAQALLARTLLEDAQRAD